jgi:hypothetical protein
MGNRKAKGKKRKTRKQLKRENWTLHEHNTRLNERIVELEAKLVKLRIASNEQYVAGKFNVRLRSPTIRPEFPIQPDDIPYWI